MCLCQIFDLATSLGDSFSWAPYSANEIANDLAKCGAMCDFFSRVVLPVSNLALLHILHVFLLHACSV